MTKSDDWLIARWQRNGFPTLVRMATAYRDQGRLPGYDHRIVIVMPLGAPEPSGMPAEQEYDALDAAEQSICHLMEAENESIQVLAITGCGTRDLIFYTRDPEKAREQIARAQEMIANYRLDAAIERDSEWELYGFFSRSLARSPASERPN